MTGATGPADYLVDPFGAQNLSQVLRETSASGAVDYVHGGEVLLSMRRPTGTSFYLKDGHRSTRMLADAAGAVTDRYDYDPFGSLRAREGTTPNEFLFDGQRLDSALRLYDLRARLYDPVAGRFTTRDPFDGIVFDPGSLHPYTYAHNDPVNNSDPSGRFTLGETMVVSAGIGVMAGLAYAAESYYYYRSAELAFEVGVDAAFSYASLVMDAMGVGALARQVGKQIISGVSAAMAGRTLVTQSADDVGRSVQSRLNDVFENVLCRTNNFMRCRSLTVVSYEEAAAQHALREAARIAERDVALAEVRVGAEEVARRAAERSIRWSTVTLGELLNVTVEGVKGGFRTVLKWFEKRPRSPL
jgi:RHS repeat-associated protein